MGTTIKLKRGTKDRWESLNIILQAGEPGVCFDDGNITMKLGDGVQGWNELPSMTYTQQDLRDLIDDETSGTTSSSVSKISFGNIPDSTNDTYPTTFDTTLGHKRRERYYPDLYNNFDTIYSDFLWTLNWSDGTKGVTEQKFDDINSLYDYIKENVPNDGKYRTSSYNVECLAKQTDDIGKINKIYGMNKFFSILKGKGNYKQRICHLGEVYDDLRYPQKSQFIKGIWDYFHPGIVQEETEADFAPCTWLSPNYHTMYGLLKPGNSITFTNNDAKGRKLWGWGDSSIHNQVNYTMTVQASVLVGLTPYSSSFEIMDSVTDETYNKSYSYVRVYRLTGQNGTDNFTCLYVKPVGMDTFRLNYVPNAANLDLYIYAYNGWGDDQPIVKKLSNVYWNVDESNQMKSDLSFIINKDQWSFATFNRSTKKHIGETKQKRFRFFLGDGNGNISKFSPEVYPYTHRTGAKSRTKINGM